MVWMVIAAAGLAIGLTVAFWREIVTWANQRIAGWLGEMYGEEVKEAFLLLLAGVDRTVILAQRAVAQLQERIVKASILFRQLQGGQAHEKVVQAQLRTDDDEIIDLESAEIVPWHELPDDVREKFIRRQSATVEMELKLKE